jgi:serine/threonine-protein kinase
MGVVYVAEDTLLRRRVAIKFPNATASRSRLLAEARAASALSHPAIAAIYDCGEVDNSPYIVMELVEGESLGEALRKGALTVERSLEIAIQVAGALCEAHSRHIIHRDIKPSNIRIDRRGAVKVVDFGLAKMLPGAVEAPSAATPETRTMEGAIIGTPQYLSPEQARGEGGDERSDIFSLGVVLYECLAGRRPFRGDSAADVLVQVLRFDPPPPSRWNRSVSPAVDGIVRKALAKDRAERYQNAGELLRDLEEARAAAAPPPGRRIPLPPLFAASRRVRLAALGAVLLAVALGGVWFRQRLPVYQPKPEVLRWYREGIGAIRDGTYWKAAKALERATSLDPQFPLAHARLADAYNELDDANRATQEILRAIGDNRVRLSRQDELAIQAVHRVLTLKYDGAAETYRAMLSGAAELDKPALYVDLGRDQEKAQNSKEAMASYQEAARRSPDYPAAFLRIGVLGGRLKDFAASAAAFDHAESLYGTLSNVEGATEVLYQRAVVSVEAGHVDEAASLLEHARQMAGNDHQVIAVLLQMSAVDIRKGDTSAAELHAARALDLARQMGLERLTAKGLVTLGNAYFVRGDPGQAEKYFNQALDYARRFGAQRTEARALLTLGSLHERQSDYDRAVKEIELALPFYERGGYQTETSQARLLLGRLRRKRGDYEGALSVFRQQLDMARGTGDVAQQATALEGMGFCEYDRERYPAALAHFEERTTASRSQGKQLGVAYGLLQSSGPLCRLGRYAEAKAALQEARAIASRPGGDASLRVQNDLADAEVALSERRYPDALAIARRLSAGVEGLEIDERIEAQQILGEAATRSGAPREGEQACRQALELARKSGLPRPVPPALICHAEALIANGRPQPALDDARAAQQDCARTGRKECEATAWLAVARAAAGSGDRGASRDAAARALQSFEALGQTLDAKNQMTFDSRPDVRQWRKEAQSALGGLNASAAPRLPDEPIQ